MNRWQIIALLAIGFALGSIGTSACGDAEAGSAEGTARAVVYLNLGAGGENCVTLGVANEDCCPDGFSVVGVNGSDLESLVCLED